MVVNNPTTNTGTKHSPQPEPKTAPKHPPDNTAAKQSPKATRTAVENSFGDMPNNAEAKQYITTTAGGNDAKTPEGKPGNPVKVVQDGSGNPYMVLPDGQYAVTDTGNPIVYDKANANKPVAIDPKTGHAVTDATGNILAVGDDGKFIKTPQGDNVVYDKTRNKYNLMATGEDGIPLVIEGHPAAVGKDGNYLQSANQDPLVYDKLGNTVALDKDGKIITDPNGNALALDKNGKFLPDVVYDKATGFRVKTVDGKAQANKQGQPFAVDENGALITGKDGFPAFYDPRGVAVQYYGKTPKTNAGIYQEADTGKLVGVTNDYVFTIDPATGDLATDANGHLLPAIYDPVNSDLTRPPVRPNQDAATTLKNLPRGTERGDPMAIRNDLFDTYGNLSVDKLTETAGKYDARDVYDALINASKFGGWDNMPTAIDNVGKGGTLVHPDEQQAREVIATFIAWQNMNGKYAPLRNGAIPPVLLFNGDMSKTYGSEQDGVTYVNTGAELPRTIFHEMNHAMESAAFDNAYADPNDPTGPSMQKEFIIEYIATKWTGNHADSGYEKKNAGEFKKLDEVVKSLGGGDIDKGMDLLQRAAFAGDPAAIQALLAVYPPA